MKLKTVIDDIKHEIGVLKGEETKDKIYASQHTFPDQAAAQEAFIRSKEKLFYVNGWSDLSIFTADFTLYDATGSQPIDRQPQVGDYIQIKLPGPLPENWVLIVHLTDNDQSAEFTVKPSRNPQQPDESAPEIAHFFQSQASSTFRVERVDSTINAYEIGQNEAINNRDQSSGDRSLVNTLIAEVGWLFHQLLQWKVLTDYLVHTNE